MLELRKMNRADALAQWQYVTALPPDENGLTKLIFMPIEEQFHLPRSRAGWPRKECNMKIMEHFAEMSAEFGVKINIDSNGIGSVEL